MSELKAFEVTGKALFGRTFTKKVYDKAEADKYIIGIKQNLLNVEKTLHDLDELDKKEIAHHKYKRCVAMAKWCESDIEQWVECSYRWQRRKNWHKRWLKLAEHYKEMEKCTQRFIP